MVNGIVGFGCKAFYGAKAVRFILASHSQLKYGARLINSFLGDNSTISCCEVLNSLIFPAHEQHHNNSFLCASTLKGQSNMAAGATIGSNHNSRGPDGEIIAGRGFWPGLCVSLKHNSKFASYTLIAKGDFPAELNIPLPFSLVSNDVSNDRLVIMPAYWFMYNMYALARNAGKYESRDKRTFKNQFLEYDYLAPDSVNEIFDAIDLIKTAVGKSHNNTDPSLSSLQVKQQGEKILEEKTSLDAYEILLEGIENTSRKVQLVKASEAYHIYKELVIYYGVTQVLALMDSARIDSIEVLVKQMGNPVRTEWLNIGGQLVSRPAIDSFIQDIHDGRILSWDEVHEFYKSSSQSYQDDKRRHAFAALLEITGLKFSDITQQVFMQLLDQALTTREWMVRGIYESRAKDYTNPFRQMVYDTEQEMEKVVGKLKDNSFIRQQQEELEAFRKKVAQLHNHFQHSAIA
jgi:hypothetical protein